MTNNEVIANLVKENMELKERNESYVDTLRSIRSSLICIGGPLNDNFLRYSKKQLYVFFKIDQQIRDVI